MDYTVIFSDLNKIKVLLKNLMKSNTLDLKNVLDNLPYNSFKKVIQIQYIYLYLKSLDLLHINKSLKIIELENNLKLIANKKISSIINVFNKLGYVDIMLILLNISNTLFQQIKEYISKTKNIKLVSNNINISSIDFNSNHNKLVESITSNVLEKLNTHLTSKKHTVPNHESHTPESHISESHTPEESSEIYEKLEQDDPNTLVMSDEIKNLENNMLDTYEIEGKTDKIKLSKYDINLLNKLDE
jgi:hypothetical protein